MNKENSLDEAIKEFNKTYGVGSIIISGEDGVNLKIDSIPTGSFSLDEVFGCGGMPRGRMIEVYGAESSGKSTLALFIVAQIQKRGGKAMWIDTEFSFSEDYAKNIGVDTDNLIVSQPDTGEEALDAIGKFASTGALDIIVLDSVAAMIPRKELEGEIGDAEMAQQARLMSKAMRYLMGKVSSSKTAVIFINQERDKVGQFFGKKTTTPGGKALKFYASVRLQVIKGESLKDKSGDVIGNVMKICAVKNKVGKPWRRTELKLYYEHGVDLMGEVIDSAVDKGILKKAGAWYSYGDIKLGAGYENTKEFLKNDEKLYNTISSQVRGEDVAKEKEKKNTGSSK